MLSNARKGVKRTGFVTTYEISGIVWDVVIEVSLHGCSRVTVMVYVIVYVKETRKPITRLTLYVLASK